MRRGEEINIRSAEMGKEYILYIWNPEPVSEDEPTSCTYYVRFIEEIEDSLESGEWNKAEALCRKMLDLYEAHQLGEFYFVISLFEQRRFQESLVENRKLISKFPDFFEGHLQLANNLETVQDFSGAISVYLQLLDMPLKADFEDIVLKRLNKLTNRDK